MRRIAFCATPLQCEPSARLHHRSHLRCTQHIRGVSAGASSALSVLTDPDPARLFSGEVEEAIWLAAQLCLSEQVRQSRCYGEPRDSAQDWRDWRQHGCIYSAKG